MEKYHVIDLHMHTIVSDGSDTPEEILANVRKEKIEVFSVTDHDAIKGCREIRRIRRQDDPKFIPGVEFSCKDEKGKYHILGYHYDPEGTSIIELVNKGHSLRITKLKARLQFLKDRFQIDFPKAELEKLFSLDNPGKPHIGNLMVKYGFVKTKELAIRDFINQLHISSQYVRPEEAIRGILGSGGIPVLAHPFFGSGDQLILNEEMESRLEMLMEYGLQGVEAFYSGFSPKLIGTMLKYAEKYHLYVTAGSDYHGTNKIVRLGDTGMDSDTVWPDGLKKFLEICIGESGES